MTERNRIDIEEISFFDERFDYYSFKDFMDAHDDTNPENYRFSIRSERYEGLYTSIVRSRLETDDEYNTRLAKAAARKVKYAATRKKNGPTKAQIDSILKQEYGM